MGATWRMLSGRWRQARRSLCLQLSTIIGVGCFLVLCGHFDWKSKVKDIATFHHLQQEAFDQVDQNSLRLSSHPSELQHLPSTLPSHDAGFSSRASDVAMTTAHRVRLSIHVFDDRMTSEERQIVFEILRTLDEVSLRHGIPYFVCGGTLLGSYRHHNLIPWDDDVDVYFNQLDREDLYAALGALSPQFEVFAAGKRLKFYSHRSHNSSEYPWKYPYVDINFFIENSTHIVDSDPTFARMAYPRESIFPLHRRPLGNLSLPAPFDTLKYLTITYLDLAQCATIHYDHRNETFLGLDARKAVWCSQIKRRFPFVYRTLDPITGVVRETLKIRDKVLHTILVQGEPPAAADNIFGLE